MQVFLCLLGCSMQQFSSSLREAESFLQLGQDLRERGEAQKWVGPSIEVMSEKVPAFGSESLA